MKILHYSLGFPPYARGGLTKYAIDIATEQVRQGHDVGMLWPGRILKGSSIKIKQSKAFQGIKSFELENPEYLPQIYGIRDFEGFQKNVDTKVYEEFLNREKPDVIHIHTLMGMHIGFLETANKLKIKTVYTTHDFFGICPKTTLFFNNEICEKNFECKGCYTCCENALSIKKMKLLQSPVYRNIKNTKILGVLRKYKKNKIFVNESGLKELQKEDKTYSENYRKLREGYIRYFEKISTIHFNSTYMRDVFRNYINVDKGIVCNITHGEIKDNKKKYTKTIENNVVKISYLGPIAEYKGFYVLKEALNQLYHEGIRNFQLTVYNGGENMAPYINNKPSFKYEELDEVMNEADLVVALRDVSYGFTVLEALSYGVPVMVTDKVGAKDLVCPDKTGIICDYHIEKIKTELKELLNHPEKIEKMKNNVLNMFEVPLIERHVKDIINGIYR